MTDAARDMQEITIRGGLPGNDPPVIATALNGYANGRPQTLRVFQEQI